MSTPLDDAQHFIKANRGVLDLDQLALRIHENHKHCVALEGDTGSNLGELLARIVSLENDVRHLSFHVPITALITEAVQTIEGADDDQMPEGEEGAGYRQTLIIDDAARERIIRFAHQVGIERLRSTPGIKVEDIAIESDALSFVFACRLCNRRTKPENHGDECNASECIGIVCRYDARLIRADDEHAADYASGALTEGQIVRMLSRVSAMVEHFDATKLLAPDVKKAMSALHQTLYTMLYT